MPWRWYPKINKFPRADGTVARYKSRCKKWIKSGNKPYKPQKRGLEKPSIWSSRFGLLDSYNRKEQQELKCPSGYSLSQCFNVLRKLWYGYHRARIDNEGIEKMEKYAKAIQDVQKDMGIKTTSFPHLGVYGDVFILNNKKGERVVLEDHSALKKKQEKYEKWQAENSKEIQQHVQKPNKEEGEEIVIFPDDVYQSKKVKPEEDEIVPDVCEPDEEEGEELITMIDEIPFQDTRNKKEGQEIVTFADDVYPHKIIEPEDDEIVPHMLEADEEAGEELIIMTDDIPFLNNHNTKKTSLEYS